MSNKQLSMALATIAALALSAPAAAFVTDLFSGASGCSGSGIGGRTCTTSDGTVKATAHAFTGSPSNSVVEAALLGVYGGGLGVSYLDTQSGNESTSSPQHALDNDNRFEFILVDFGLGNSRILDAVMTGWVESDADITVLAHTGAGVADPNGQNITGLTTNGWSLVGHSDGTSADSQTIDVNAGNASARYWLIGAFDPDFGTPYNGATHPSKNGGKYDYLKVYAVKWDKPTDAAEPATLLLFAAGLIAWLSSRRRTARF